MTQEEKVLLLGALFHDIGKFVQRCTDKTKSHPSKGIELVEEVSNELINILESDENFNQFKQIISTHHNPQTELSKYCREADHISASERVNKEENEEGGTDWNNNFLCSLFTKIKLCSNQDTKPKYYRHEQLTKENYNALIPDYDEDDDNALRYKYTQVNLVEFKTQLKTILSFYRNKDDFNTLISLLLVLFEKWLWCVPDFTGSPQTDISLYNHLKDVAGLSHAIYKTHKDNPEDRTLNIVIGDIPGIQDYIFDVVFKKPAKILRGRSIFIQVLARNFASKFLEKFGLTECNLIMLAGGKFYIIAPNTNDFKDCYNKARIDIENYLAKTFNYEMSFVAGYENFNWEKLKKREITFGEIIDKATENLNSNKSHLFKNFLFANGALQENNFILPEDYIESKDGDSNNIKCRVTDKPIRKGREGKIPDGNGKYVQVDKQVELEYKIGDEVVDSNLFLELTENKLDINRIYTIENAPISSEKPKVLINPQLDELLKDDNKKKDILRNTLFLEVANYASTEKEKKDVMDFETMSKQNDGAEYLTLIKGDIDNLGLIMAYGLARDKNDLKNIDDERDLTAISRTTTLSNHLKYFFSFFMNGFLKEWELSKQKEMEGKAKIDNPNISEEELKKVKNENRIYTVFAGGDDLMIICPHSSSLKLLKRFNEQFNEFACSNSEVHISYSLTNFKHDTPIRIVAAMAEENQKEAKKKFKSKQKPDEMLNHASCLNDENDKAGTYLFETVIKNKRHEDLIIEKERLAKWVEDNNNPVTMGTIQNLLQIAELMKAYREKNDTSKLIWHPMLTYYINRNIKGKKKTDPEVEAFFNKALNIYKDDEAKQLEDILYPVLCETIYKLRK